MPSTDFGFSLPAAKDLNANLELLRKECASQFGAGAILKTVFATPQRGEILFQQHRAKTLLASTAKVADLLTHYHGLPRRGVPEAKLRITTLKHLHAACEMCLSHLRDEAINPLSEGEALAVSEMLKVQSAAGLYCNFLETLIESYSPKNRLKALAMLQSGVTSTGKRLQAVTGAHVLEALDPRHLRFDKRVNLENWQNFGLDEIFEMYIKTKRKAKESGSKDFPPYIFWLEASGIQLGDFETLHEGVNYFDEKERVAHSVEIIKGYMYRADSNSVFASLVYGEDKGFSFDENEVLRLFDHKLGVKHHSTPTAGAAVICAGDLSIDYEGRVQSVTCATGHYASTPDMMYNFLEYLEEHEAIVPNYTKAKVITLSAQDFERNSREGVVLADAFLDEVRRGSVGKKFNKFAEGAQKRLGIDEKRLSLIEKFLSGEK